MKSLETEIVINSPAERIWNILTDFEKYPEWNPFIRSIDGKVSEGEKFKVTIQPPNSKPMRFHPRCMVLKKNKEFRWLGHLLIKGIFDGEHIFELKEIEIGRTKLIHRENFKGILVPFLWKKLDTDTKSGFIEMNKALKKKVENENK